MPGPVGIARVDIRCNTNSVTTGLDKVKTQTRAAMAQVKKQVNESNRTLSLFGEAFGVHLPRHIRTFVSELPGVSTAMSAAFSGVAIIVLVKLLADAVEKIKKFKEGLDAAKEAPNKIREGFQALNGSLQEGNDKLQLTNDTLRNAIAKLEGKPQNNLAIALDEARIHAYDLGQQLQSDIKKVNELLEKNKVSAWTQPFTGEQKSDDLVAARTAHEKALEGITRDFGAQLHAPNLSKDQVTEIQRKMYDALGAETKRWKGVIDQQVVNAKAEQALYEGQRNSPGYSPTAARGAPYAAHNSASRLGVAQGMADEAVQEGDREVLDRDNVGLGATLHGLKSNPKGSGNQNEVIRKNLEHQYELFAASHEKTLANEENFWDGIILKSSKGSEQYKMAGEKLLRVFAEQRAEEERTRSEFGKTLTKLGEESRPGLTEEDKKGLERDTKNTLEWFQAMGEGAREQSAVNAAMEEANVKYDEQTGRISKNTAAMELARIKAAAFAQQIQDLKAKRAQIQGATYLNSGEKRLQSQQTTNQIAQLTGDMNVEARKAQADVDSQSALAGMHEFWLSMVEDADNAAKTVNALFTQAMNEVNAQLVNGMMGKKMDWGKTFGSLASSTLSSGLKTGEGMIGKALGLGGKKGDSPMNPMYVSQVNALPGAAGGAGAAGGGGGIFGSLLKLFHIPGFAEGGYPSGLAMVGENGPELANFGGGGHVTSNSDVRAMLKGGGGSPVYNIDARGSNAADVQMRVKQAMQVTHAHAVQSSMQAQRELAARRPRSS